MSNINYHGDAPLGQARQGHSSTRVMAPPGGRSSNIFGTDAPSQAPAAQGRNRQQPGGQSSMSQVMNFTENQAQPVQPREFKSDTIANVFPEASGVPPPEIVPGKLKPYVPQDHGIVPGPPEEIQPGKQKAYVPRDQGIFSDGNGGQQRGGGGNRIAPKDNNIFTSDNSKPKSSVGGVHAPPGGHSSISFGSDAPPPARALSPRGQSGAESAVSPRRAAVKAQQAPGGQSSISFGDDGGASIPAPRKGGRALVQPPGGQDHNVFGTGGGDSQPQQQQAHSSTAVRQAPGGQSNFSFGKDSAPSDQGPGAAKKIDYARYKEGNRQNHSNIFSTEPVPDQQPRSGRRVAQAPGGNSNINF